MAGEFIVNNKIYFFLHIPKTGGTTWSKIFRNIGLTTGHGFLKFKPDGYSFALIRNPLDRLVSCFFYLKNGGCHIGDYEDAVKYNIIENTFDSWIYKFNENPSFYFKQQHIMPMISRIGKKEYLDHIGLYENLENETLHLYKLFFSQEIKLKIPIINKSSHQHFEKYYNLELKNIVKKLYEEDITLYEEINNGKII